MIGKKRGARIGAAVSALAIAATVALAAPASAGVYRTGTTSCGDVRAASINAYTGAGTTVFRWAELGSTYYTRVNIFPGYPTGWKSYPTGINNITWRVEAPSISSAYGGCYYP
jgi:hypothetical protein